VQQFRTWTLIWLFVFVLRYFTSRYCLVARSSPSSPPLEVSMKACLILCIFRAVDIQDYIYYQLIALGCSWPNVVQPPVDPDYRGICVSVLRLGFKE